MTIDGVKVLAQEVIYETPDFVWVIAGFLVGGGVLFAILGLITDADWLLIPFTISLIGGVLWMMIAGFCGVFDKPSDRNVYKCYFEKDISIQEVYDNYKVVGRDGDIWILKDKK